MQRVLTAVVALGLIIVPPAASADDYPRNWDVDVLHYRFHLSLSDDNDRIAGRADIEVRFAAAGIRDIALDLIGRDGAAPTGMEVVDVTREGRAVSWTHRDDKLTLSLTEPSIAEQRRTFTVAYRGVPADGLIIDTNMFGDRTFFGDNWPDRARHWLPTVDHVSDKATVEWIVVAPDHYQVVANGRLVEVSAVGDGTRRTHWRSTAPLATKVMVFGAARFAVQHLGPVAGIPVQSWVYPQNRDAGFYDYALAARALRFFDTHIGPFPYAKLANVQSKTRYGGMENAGNIFYSERSVTGTRAREGLIAHEVAHQWFGDAVTERDWHHLWLSEGFATYFAQLYNEFVYGRDEMVRGMRGARQTVIRFHAANPELALIAEQLRDPNDMLNRNAYQKGAWLLHMLRRRIGDQAFWSGIRDYYHRYRDANAMTADFRRVMEQASGQDLAGFFRQWSTVPGHPVLAGEWSYDAASGRVDVGLRQVQANSVTFRFALDIGVIGADNGMLQRETVSIDSDEHTFSFAAEAAPTDVILDPDTWLLFEGGLSRK